MERQAGEMVLLYEDDTLSVATKGIQFREAGEEGIAAPDLHSLACLVSDLLRSIRVPLPDLLLAYLVQDMFEFRGTHTGIDPGRLRDASTQFHEAAIGLAEAREALKRDGLGGDGAVDDEAGKAVGIPVTPEPKPARRHEVETRLREAAEYATSVIDAGAVLLKDGDGYVKLRNALAYAEDYSAEPEGLTFEGRVAASWHTAKGHASLEVIPAAPVHLPGGPAYGHRVRVTFLPDTES